MNRPTNKTRNLGTDRSDRGAGHRRIPAGLLFFGWLKTPKALLSANTEATFVGSVECEDCHKPEYDKWLGSHHDLAMDVANETFRAGRFQQHRIYHPRDHLAILQQGR